MIIEITVKIRDGKFVTLGSASDTFVLEGTKQERKNRGLRSFVWALREALRNAKSSNVDDVSRNDGLGA